MDRPQKRKLIFLWPYVEWGGAQVYCMSIIKRARDDWDITVIMPRASSAELVAMVERLGARIDYVDAAMDLKPAPTLSRKLARQIARVKAEIQSFNALRRYDPKRSVLHVDIAPWQSWIFYTLLSLRGANVFFTFHTFFFDLPSWRETLFKARMQIVSRLPNFHVFTANHYTRDKLKRWLPPKHWSRVAVTRASIDRAAVAAIENEGVDRQVLRRRFGIPENCYVVLTVGQFADHKGRWTLLDAAKRVIEIDPSAVFIWVAPSLPETGDATRIRSYGLGGRFRLVRSADVGGRLDVLRFFKIADCFALPSRVEGLPIAILEAMALGLPAIASNIFAIPEAVRHEETGLLMEPGDGEELTELILRLKNDPTLSAKLSAAGSKFVLANFDERDASRVAVDSFEGCLAKR